MPYKNTLPRVMPSLVHLARHARTPTYLLCHTKFLSPSQWSLCA